MFGGNTSIWKFVAFCEKASACSFSTLGNKAYIWKSAIMEPKHILESPLRLETWNEESIWNRVTFENKETRLSLDTSHLFERLPHLETRHLRENPRRWERGIYVKTQYVWKQGIYVKTRYAWEQVAFLWSPRRLETRHLCENWLRLGKEAFNWNSAMGRNKASIWSIWKPLKVEARQLCETWMNLEK